MTIKSAHKILLSFVITLLFVFAFNLSSVKAADPKLDYELTYKALDQSSLELSYDINMSFNTKGSSVTAFILNVAETDVSNLKVNSDRGVTASAKKVNDYTEITLKFPESKRLLAGQKTKITVSYETKEAIKTRGEVTDIIVTGFQKDDSINSLKVNISIPNSLGKLDYSSDSNIKEAQSSGGNRIYKFDKVPESGVVLSFGEHQNYKFAFNYLIKNSSKIQNQIASITIPFENENQKLRFKNVQPSPYKSYEDSDGNYILQYLVKPEEDIDVKIEGFATLYAKDNSNTNQIELTEDEIAMFTKEQEYWVIDPATIDDEFENKVNNEPDTDKKAKLIYDYVLGKLTYSENQLSNKNRKRLGAEAVLKNPKIAICQEYSDLFVGLARYFKIPARSIAGYAYPTTGYELPPNTLHSWAEYYSEAKGWIDVDPTWEDTSNGLDYFGSIGLNHFPIAIYASNSVEPALVLSFVPEEDNSDNLQIEPVNDEELEKNLPASVPNKEQKLITLHTSDKLFSGIQSDSQLFINNQTNEILKDILITVDGNEIRLDTENKKVIVLPDSVYQIPITLSERNWLFSGEKEFKIRINATVLGKPYSDETTVKQKFISPFLSAPMFVFAIGIFTLAAITILFIPIAKKTKNRLSLRRNKEV
ncbi:transglutaminase domain-containing protein [Candidatus Dojkabacteria bacterium]|uniref:Transglutaminase domain-containing protein n=1 Tax=Candidatus Dojkabacteria bacterium TaxID=2099670 RepID=A0A955L335_9BACT|nr:transglutaminase domain-containing protein [Candidatus Dojkabacteria bacterium]